MAGKKIKSNETMYNAVALRYIKYNGERIAPGTEFLAKESDIEELKEKECAEIKDAVQNNDSNTPGQGGAENDGSGNDGEGA
ncbi:hypothetical protein [Clostridium beijerinckii]|uniref:hypothetical protein n=1 Tax=Clostridium beijerinckii TaxID=1520 RepID=UPI0003D391B0|nr:hypothetical protein [Clostridium beijerinckii]ALB46219.1 hypothetical protein X276_13720 [Clostridium beijerinckii NRRL B-598]